ncbi:MAG: hypothetical protein DBX59_02485 [Bacillota bacterium]|nr:MAG: hypothetical protein DBX59_02485 [Bacillota bacterium]
MKKGKLKKLFAVLAGCCMLSATLVVSVGCNNGSNYRLPEETLIDAGVLYTPEFHLQGQTTAIATELKGPASSDAKLNGNSFTPDVLGKYEYSVVFSENGDTKSQKKETIVFTAVDRIAPSVVKKVIDKQAEIGFYTKLQDDLKTVVAQDNCATVLSVYPISLRFGEKETPLAADADVLFLSETGEYTLTYGVSDFSGNKVADSYKILVSDTTAPVIDAPDTLVVWAEEGKTKLPVVNVIDTGRTEYTVTAKNASGEDVAVSDGYLMTAQTGTYILSYKAADAAGNESETFTMTLIVNEKPLLTDFDNANEAQLWNSTAWVEGGKLRVQSTQNKVELRFSDYFAFNDWSGYNRLSLAVENRRGESLTVNIQVLSGGEWKNAAKDKIGAATFGVDSVQPSTKSCGFWLDDYGIESAEGLRITLESDNGIEAAIGEIKLENSEKMQRPSGDLSGYLSGEINLDGGEVVVRAVNGDTFGTKNCVSYRIWSSAACNVSVGLKIGEEMIYHSAALNPGWNEIFRLPEKEGADENVLKEKLNAVSVKNQELYAVDLFFDRFQITEKTSSTLEELLYGAEDIGVIYGESHAVEWIFRYDSRYIENLSVSVLDAEGETVKTGLSVGSEIAVGNGLSSGEYFLKYEFTDPFGEKREQRLALCLQKNVLTLDVFINPLFITSTSLPEPELTSEIYTDDELQQAAVEKYYRKKGQSNWTSAEDGFHAENAVWYEFRYIVTYGGIRREAVTEKYIHAGDNVIDFEPEDAAGNNCLVGNDVYEESRFLHDGGYYNVGLSDFSLNDTWSKSGDYSLYGPCISYGWQGFLINEISAASIDERGVNAVSFWLKSDAGYTTQIELGGGKTSNTLTGTGASDGWYGSEEFEVLAGEHHYTVFLTKTLKTTICSFTILAQGRVALYFDDIEFKYLERLAMETVDYPDYYQYDEPLVLRAPKLVSDVFSKEELAAADWKLVYSVGDNEEREVAPGTDGSYSIAFTERGTCKIVWSATVGGLTVTAEDTFRVGEIDVIAEIPSVMVQGDTVVLDKPECVLPLESWTAEYRQAGGEEWTLLEEKDGKVSFTPAESGYYDVRFTGYADYSGTTLDGVTIYTVYVKEEGVIFDTNITEKDVFCGGTQVTPQMPAFVMEKLPDGTNRIKIFGGAGDAWTGWDWSNIGGINLGRDTNVLIMEVESPRAIQQLPMDLKSPVDNKWHEIKVDIPAGRSTLRLEFDCNVNGMLVFEIRFTLAYFEYFYIYYFAAEEENSSSPALAADDRTAAYAEIGQNSRAPAAIRKKED